MGKFTPGPWAANIPHESIAEVRDAAGNQICRVAYPGDGPYPGEGQMAGNMLLIAAAPDMFAACQAAHTAIDILFARLIELDESFFPSKSGPPWDAMARLNEAIKKATGEQ